MKDLIIIGGGPGGYVAAIRARQLGMSAVLIEKTRLGGVCLNRGCIPTKAYYRNALLMKDLLSSNDYNIQVGSIAFDMAAARQRKDGIVDNLVAGVEKLLQANGVERITGEAALLDKNTVLVNGEEHRGKNILLASGSIPAKLAIPGLELPGVLNSDQLLELNEVPKRLAIIGGGVIGLEFACIFNALGSDVKIFEYLPELLSSLDNELGKRLRVFLKKQKIEVHTAAAVQKIEADGSCWKITALGKKGIIEADADIILAAGGRKAFTAGLNLEKLGIATDESGFIMVDQQFATNVDGIYAIGDVIGGQMLAHVASEEGIAAVENIAGMETTVHYHAVPSCVFTIPEMASVGMSEEEARAQGKAYRVGKFPFGANGKAITMGETDGMVKVIADQDDVVIGVHIIGPHASDLIMEGTVMVKNRMKAREMAGTIHPHPTLSEALMEALLDVNDKSIHIVPPRK
ncbi:MAG: dihydrolipoyl dehydrogenase [Syntrophomonadaceae bacterium]|nr:dihydrolipoyl dehydrogenase [Syntrophomonadaceae bacterium]MDD3023776.1 dihydrolipoyl dehydrogenase [Syntrophomonadaceae bacterium]